MTNARLCGAKNRAGLPCRCPAMRGKARCSKHGGKSPGGPKGEHNGNYRHGGETLEAIELRRQVSRALKTIRSEAYAQ
ncbi:MAG: HGGxSTG domain-containing protein [Sphingopyxis sp.]